ncbi:Ig-like domain-containing protein [Pantoea endophytica]|uniref:Ig-like domain-containing protein n=1 Tax=Pantoea endophytica TaxID=92488 RepID=UPI001AE73067|nr:Ig-like domain-containing protein [Pantoea endophytica]
MVDINLAVVSGRRIIQAENLPPNPNKPVTVKAEKGARYVLAEGESLTGPDMIRLKRVGNDLQLTLRGDNPETPNLVIEDYYAHPGEIVGMGEDGQWHAFTSASADAEMNPAGLQDGDYSTVLLDSAVLPPLSNLEVDGNAASYGLLAVAAAASVAALAMLTRSNSHDKSSTPPPPPEEEKPEESTAVPDDQTPGEQADATEETEQPAEEETPTPIDEQTPIAAPEATLGSIHDDVGEQQGALLDNDVTDDNTPTLSGGEQQPGSVIQIIDNGNLLGTTIADAEGNWSFTPEAALPNGSHAFVVVVTDPAGVVSAPSDPAVIVIDAAEEAPIEVLSLGDMLPADSDLSDWAQFSLADGERADYNTATPADDVSRLIDDLLGNHPLN